MAAEELVRETAREFADKRLRPMAAAIDEEERFPRELFPELGRLGLLGLLVPEAYGGSGAGHLAATVAMEELSRASGAVALSYGAHSFLCAHNLYLNGSEEQRRRYLPGLCSGESVGAFALTEPGSGSDAAGLKTRAVRKDDRYVLNGSKMFITNGSLADVVLVFARAARGSGREALSAFIVERGFPGFSAGRDIPKLGTRGSPLTELAFQDCEVPAGNMLGAEGSGLAAMLRGLDMERAVFSGMPVGLAAEAYAVASRYALERRQFGRPIGSFQLVQELLVQSAVELEAARLLAYQAARRLDEGLPATKEASSAKLFGAQMVMRATQAAVQVLGGYGFTREFPVERFYRDAALVGIGGGTSQVQILVLARELAREARGRPRR